MSTINDKVHAPPADGTASRPAATTYLRRINWRGALAVVLFFLAWYLAVTFKLPGFAELPTPFAVLAVFVQEYGADASYWNSW